MSMPSVISFWINGRTPLRTQGSHLHSSSEIKRTAALGKHSASGEIISLYELLPGHRLKCPQPVSGINLERVGGKICCPTVGTRFHRNPFYPEPMIFGAASVSGAAHQPSLSRALRSTVHNYISKATTREKVLHQGSQGWRPAGPCFIVQETPVLLTKQGLPQPPMKASSFFISFQHL